MIASPTKPICTFTLPLPPSINGSYGVRACYRTGKSRIVSKAEHKRFKKDAALLLANQKQLLGKEEREAYNRAIEDIRRNGLFLFLEIFYFLEDILERDEDNSIKVTQDVVCRSLGIDDKYVMDVHAGKRRAYGDPRCEIAVYLFQE